MKNLIKFSKKEPLQKTPIYLLPLQGDGSRSLNTTKAYSTLGALSGMNSHCGF